jgi:hypothetical protein
MSNGIAVNIQQMKLLTSKCKSSINGSFGHLGYLPVPSGADTAGELLQAFPFMKDQFSELRQWTIRKQCDGSVPKSSPKPIPFELDANPFETRFSLDDEYAKLFTHDCPCGSFDYITPPADIDAELGDGISLSLDSHFGEKDDERGFSMFGDGLQLSP